MSQTLIQPELTEETKHQQRWMVVIFNNQHNTIDEVVEILIQATGCDEEEAAIETWEAHTYGKASVHFAAKEECEGAAKIISTIGLKTEVSLEWGESA